MRMFSFAKIWYAPAILGIALFSACSDSKVAGGNSSEVGSPEMMGTLAYEWNGSSKQAALARVYCVPVDYNPATEDNSAYYSTTADSAGSFKFDSIPSGLYNLEAYLDVDDNTFALRKIDILINADSTRQLNPILTESGKIKVYLNDPSDSDASASVVGSSYKQISRIEKDSAGYFAVFSGIPAGYYDSIQVKSSEITVSIKALDVKSAATTTVNNGTSVRTFEILLNTTVAGADLKDTLKGFPMFVDLKSIDSNSRNSLIENIASLEIFQDLEFADVGYSIVNDGAGTPNGLWVRLEKLDPQNDTQRLILRWNETAPITEATYASFANQPFSAADGFVMAWHFDKSEFSETQATYSGEMEASFNDVLPDSGVIGESFAFDGKKSYIEMLNSESEPRLQFSDTSRFTASFWVNAEYSSTARFLWGKSEAEYHFKFQYSGDTCYWMYKEFDESDATHWYEASIETESADFNNWVHFTVVKSGDSTRIYRNGLLAGTKIGHNSTDETRISDGPFVIGARKMSDGTIDRKFIGRMDEFYLQNLEQGDDWAKLLYLNQNGAWPTF